MLDLRVTLLCFVVSDFRLVSMWTVTYKKQYLVTSVSQRVSKTWDSLTSREAAATALLVGPWTMVICCVLPSTLASTCCPGVGEISCCPGCSITWPVAAACCDCSTSCCVAVGTLCWPSCDWAAGCPSAADTWHTHTHTHHSLPLVSSCPQSPLSSSQQIHSSNHCIINTVIDMSYSMSLIR